MKIFTRSVVWAVSLLLLVPAIASATTTLSSPSLHVPVGVILRCTLANVGTKPLRDVMGSAYDSAGVFQGGVSPTGGALPPGQTSINQFSAQEDSWIRCTWSFSGPKKGARAAFCVDGGGCVPLQ